MVIYFIHFNKQSLKHNLFINRLNKLYIIYAISSCSIYKNKETIIIVGNTKPTNGTRIEGK
jgi:hypothetical protein